MGEALAVATLEGTSGFTEDSAQNSFVFNDGLVGGSISLAEGLVLAQLVVDFYNATGTGSGNLADWMSRSLSDVAGSSVVKVYDITNALGGGPHGSPIALLPFALATTGNTSLVSEAALVLTLRAAGAAAAQVETPDGADPGTLVDRPRQRLTGRVYIGPLAASASVTDADFRPRPAANLRTRLLDSAEDLWNAAIAAGWTWEVWSRVLAATAPIVSAEVDDAFDTQRRRGVNPTVRNARIF